MPVSMSKIDVAACHLQEAVWLLFQGRTPIGAWSLAASAYQVIYDLAKIENKPSFLNASYTNHGSAYKALRKIKELWGEMKHANINQNDIASVTFDYAEALIFVAVHDFYYLWREKGQPMPVEIDVFHHWHQASFPGLYQITDDEREIIVQWFPELAGIPIEKRLATGLSALKMIAERENGELKASSKT